MILHIIGATGSFMSRKLQFSKIQNIYIALLYLLNSVLYKKLISLAWVSTADPSSGHFNYPYTHIYQLNLKDFAFEIHHGVAIIIAV